MQPLVSICIPCYNAENYIRETIKAALNQTYPNIEIFVCDDQSTDNTVQKIKQFNEPRIRLHINEKNLGCSGNYNHVLSYATGKYVKLLCADDIIDPDCIEKQVQAFEENADKNIVMVTANKTIINADGKRVFTMKFPGRGFFEGKKVIKMTIRRGTSIFGEPGCNLLLTEALRKTPGVLADKYYTYCNDFDLWLKMMLQGNLFVVDKILFHFRIIPNTVTSSTKWKQLKIFRKFLSRIHSDTAYNLSSFDIMMGKSIGFIKGVARNIVTSLILQKK